MPDPDRWRRTLRGRMAFIALVGVGWLAISVVFTRSAGVVRPLAVGMAFGAIIVLAAPRLDQRARQRAERAEAQRAEAEADERGDDWS